LAQIELYVNYSLKTHIVHRPCNYTHKQVVSTINCTSSWK